jgi:hypothetical protein
MRRRDALAGLWTALAAALAGCGEGGGSGRSQGPPQPPSETTDTGGDPFTTTSSTPDPAPILEVTDFRTGESEAGNLTVAVTVENVADREASAVLVLSVRAGDAEFERERVVTVDAGGSNTVEFEFETTREAFRDEGSLDFAWRSGAGDGGG